jgi:large subunit ribosomal protein L6
MSRVGKMPIELPQGVEVRLEGSSVQVKGPKGTLSWQLPQRISIRQEAGRLILERPDDSRQSKALHGLARSIVNNMVVGVSRGYSKELELQGIGYRAQLQGQKLLLTLGYSHPVEFALPEGITAQVDKRQTSITIHGIDKQKVGQVAAELRALRPPDPYKGKGIRYKGEHVKLKPGKAGKK